MPQIDTPLLLDVLLGLIVLLFVPFGIRRGVAKEAMVSAGLLLGAILAGRFNEAWGAELATRFTLDAGVARFLVSAFFLLAGAFLLGYGAGAALGAMRLGAFSRLAGGLLAAFNATLLLSYLLRWIDEFLAGGAALDDGLIGEALVRRSDWLLLAAAGVLLALTILGWIVNAARARRQPRQIDGAAAGMPARQRPVRVAQGGDAGKYEPGSESAARSGRFGPGIDATTPLPPGSSYVSGGPWPAGGSTMIAANGHGGAQLGGASEHAIELPQGSPEDTVWAAWNADASEQTRGRSEPRNPWPVTPSLGITDDERCAVCHARVGSRDVFCPECGATL